ncbi:MAG: sodium ion-translocating decarboxylase subunit beta [Candidatus Cloacimonetes bacterium]|jgi:oxaloacetate decarboxylase beta subunit|nr:sodium ion-translocating decarboxylase subunit beta [Candidatus Cloacimonadota bacterium]MDD4156099.1 sodium ion-translocating decarboxylase subunit beta [Candidatus Cloacimonadota bacterium]
MSEISNFFYTTGFAYLGIPNLLMIIFGLVFVWLGITKNYEPLLLIPIGFGMVLGNMPGMVELLQGVDADGSVMHSLYQGVKKGVYPPLIFLGIGAMTDFSTLIANPKLIILGAAAQFGIFATFMGAHFLGFNIMEAASIGIIGGADGPTSIYLSSRIAPHLIGPIALAAYSYMALVPILQPPVIKLLTTPKERVIKMKNPRMVSKREKIIFPVIGFLATVLIAPGGAALLGMLFFGNILKESGVTERLAATARTALIDICTILIGVTVGAATSAGVFLNKQSILIFVLGACSFIIATASGVIFAKVMNLFLKEKINPMIGAAGVSAVPNSARVVQNFGQQFDKSNYLLMHAMAPNVAGVIGSAVAAGVLLGILS